MIKFFRTKINFMQRIKLIKREGDFFFVKTFVEIEFGNKGILECISPSLKEKKSFSNFDFDSKIQKKKEGTKKGSSLKNKVNHS